MGVWGEFPPMGLYIKIYGRVKRKFVSGLFLKNCLICKLFLGQFSILSIIFYHIRWHDDSK